MPPDMQARFNFWTLRGPAFGPRPPSHLSVQSRWTPLWPVLDGSVPNLPAAGRESQQLLNRFRQFRDGCVRFVQSVVVTSQAGPVQGLVVSSLRSRHSPPEGIPPPQSMSGSIIPLAAFQASTDGRFWVSPEVWG